MGCGAGLLGRVQSTSIQNQFPFYGKWNENLKWPQKRVTNTHTHTHMYREWGRGQKRGCSKGASGQHCRRGKKCGKWHCGNLHRKWQLGHRATMWSACSQLQPRTVSLSSRPPLTPTPLQVQQRKREISRQKKRLNKWPTAATSGLTPTATPTTVSTAFRWKVWDKEKGSAGQG